MRKFSQTIYLRRLIEKLCGYIAAPPARPPPPAVVCPPDVSTLYLMESRIWYPPAVVLLSLKLLLCLIKREEPPELPFLPKKAGNTTATPLSLLMPMDGDEYQLFGSLLARLPL
ncbi:hypothetical protein EVAR_34418_1 [Eumeta japonica]|uniref:Uncharacterized protein n=1 Tax=Eumeta variegata TaxID=151549 RepID=A0A4C1WM23_EUMVA|nr:hypothetical protein EVAR_34418_1 [Eumeta japonica]